MANILEKYGIKEVADVTFYALDSNGNIGAPVLFLDTLKVSTIEQTAESTDARGGKGNPALISWDYGKEITVTLEDALFSAKSMAIMFGNGTAATTTTGSIRKTVEWIATGTSAPSSIETTINGKKYTLTNVSIYTPSSTDENTPASSNVTSVSSGETYYATGYIDSKNITEIEISANSFPGTYYVTGDTYARAFNNGADEFFQFQIMKAKVQSENTITLEAEGDPSVFNMSLKVLRDKNGDMMKLVKYDLTTAEG